MPTILPAAGEGVLLIEVAWAIKIADYLWSMTSSPTDDASFGGHLCIRRGGGEGLRRRDGRAAISPLILGTLARKATSSSSGREGALSQFVRRERRVGADLRFLPGR
jgi:hypothetical protein